MARSIPDLGDGSCQVWWARRAAIQHEFLVVLEDVERDRVASFTRLADRERFVIGCVVIRRVLGHHFAIAPADVVLDRTCPECHQPHGKIRLAVDDEHVELSVSHSGDFVVVAFHRSAPVGVDVERIDSTLDSAELSALALSDDEGALLRDLPPAARARAFSAYWTRKEAVVKATGDGLRASLPEITVSPPNAPARLLGWSGRPQIVIGTQLHDLKPDPEYAAALAVLSDTPVAVREFDVQRWLDW